MLKDTQVLEDYIVTMSNTVILGKQWQSEDSKNFEDLLRPTGLLMYTDRNEVGKRKETTVLLLVASIDKVIRTNTS